MDRNAAPPGESEESNVGGTQAYQRLKPNSVGLIAVVFMAIATAAPITAMTGNVPVAVGFGNGTGAPAGYLVATVVLTLFSVGYIAMSRYITAAGAFYGYISHGLGQVVGMASGLQRFLWPPIFCVRSATSRQGPLCRHRRQRATEGSGSLVQSGGWLRA